MTGGDGTATASAASSGSATFAADGALGSSSGVHGDGGVLDRSRKGGTAVPIDSCRCIFLNTLLAAGCNGGWRRGGVIVEDGAADEAARSESGGARAKDESEAGRR